MLHEAPARPSRLPQSMTPGDTWSFNHWMSHKLDHRTLQDPWGGLRRGSHSRMNKGQLRGGGDMLEVTGSRARKDWRGDSLHPPQHLCGRGHRKPGGV